MTGYLRTRVPKQPIIAFYFEFETPKFYNLEAWSRPPENHKATQPAFDAGPSSAGQRNTI